MDVSLSYFGELITKNDGKSKLIECTIGRF